MKTYEIDIPQNLIVPNPNFQFNRYVQNMLNSVSFLTNTLFDCCVFAILFSATCLCLSLNWEKSWSNCVTFFLPVPVPVFTLVFMLFYCIYVFNRYFISSPRDKHSQYRSLFIKWWLNFDWQILFFLFTQC